MSHLVEFTAAQDLLRAIPLLRQRGVAVSEAYTPHAIGELEHLLPQPPSRVRLVMLVMAAVGAATAFGLQAWSAVIAYPFNSGGRPPFSWPAFLPTTFELLVLFAAVGGIVALFHACRLTRLDHPLFDLPEFERASQDRFFLEIRSDDADIDARIRRILAERPPVTIRELPA